MASMMYMLMIRERTQQRLKARNLRLLFGGTIESHKKSPSKVVAVKGKKQKRIVGVVCRLSQTLLAALPFRPPG